MVRFSHKEEIDLDTLDYRPLIARYREMIETRVWPETERQENLLNRGAPCYNRLRRTSGPL